MAHFGVLCYSGEGHLNPLAALSRELVSRGHKVTFFLPAEFEQSIRRRGLDFFPIVLSGIEPNRCYGGLDAPTASGQREDLRVKISRFDQEIGSYIRAYVAALSVVRVDVLLMGEITLAGPTVAEMLHVPYLVISTSIPHKLGWTVSQEVLSCHTLEEPDARIFEVTIFSMRGPVLEIMDGYRRDASLGPLDESRTSFPELAHITQWPKCLDTQRPELPERFFYTGPFVDAAARCPVDFPWHKLDGRPIVYVSLGTTRKADPEIYRRIASACAGLGLQLVITLGGRRNLEQFADMSGDSIVVANAPQLDLLKRAYMVITHAGPNTALEALLFGLPMLALPLALDQPAVAARLEMLGIAEVLPAQHRSEGEIRAALHRVSTESRFRHSAQAIQAQLQRVHGTEQAASIVEEALRNSDGLPRQGVRECLRLKSR